jgi:hypothetical protein
LKIYVKTACKVNILCIAQRSSKVLNSGDTNPFNGDTKGQDVPDTDPVALAEFKAKKSPEIKLALGNGRFLTAGDFQGSIKIHIREFDEQRPTKKGVTFSDVRWASLIFHLDSIDAAVQKLCAGEPVDFMQHIGKGLNVCVNSGYKCVNFRKFFIAADGQKRPSPFGIALRIPEWVTLKERAHEIGDQFPDVAAAVPCFLQFTHQNLISMMECPECNILPASPFDPMSEFNKS